MIGRQIGFEAQGTFPEAPQHKRRIERNGVEGIGRVTDKLPPRAPGRDNRNPGRKGTKRFTKMAGIGGRLHCYLLARLLYSGAHSLYPALLLISLRPVPRLWNARFGQASAFRCSPRP